jgi:GntR family transcriptional regulator
MNRTISRSQQLHEQLRRLITATEPGGRLLTEPELARQLGVSRATLREAMRIFETEGLIRRRQGSGTFVIHPSHVIDTGLEVLESIETLAARIGLEVELGRLKVDQRGAGDEEAKALEINAGDGVIVVSRTIQAEGRPVAFLVDTLPENVLVPADLQISFSGSVLDLLLKRGTPPLGISRTDINATTATSEVARALDIQRGDVLLNFTAKLYSTSGEVVDYSYSYFLPGYFHFHVVRRIG